MESLLNEPTSDVWQQIAPLLDDAMGHLSEKDRNVVVLRFFQNKSAAEIGDALGIDPSAAQKRITRAVGKLRKFFIKRSVAHSTELITGAISAHSVHAAPVGLAKVITAVALAKGAAIGGSTLALVKGTMKTMAWLKMKLALSLSVSVLAAGGVAVVITSNTNEPPTNPAVARQILQAAFAHVSSPLPAQMRFVADVEVESKPWTEAQISAEVQRQEDDEHKSYQKIVGLRDEDLAKLPEAAQEQRQRGQADLREIRLESTRTYHSATRTFIEQEWLSGSLGSLWRLDQTETTTKPEKLKALDKPLPAEIIYETTMINASDTNFASHTIYHRQRVAWFNNSNWKKSCFWEAATLEPSIGFLLNFAVSDIMDFARQARTKPHKDIDSFAGIKLDTNKLETLISGKDGRWIVETDDAVLNGRKMAVLRLKGKNISLAHGEEIAFFADTNNLTNIYRIELTGMPLMKTPYISIRDDFDTNGFPHTWIVETPKEETLTKTVKFKEVEFPAKFDDKAIFSPEIPAGYSINGRTNN